MASALEIFIYLYSFWQAYYTDTIKEIHETPLQEASLLLTVEFNQEIFILVYVVHGVVFMP